MGLEEDAGFAGEGACDDRMAEGCYAKKIRLLLDISMKSSVDA